MQQEQFILNGWEMDHCGNVLKKNLNSEGFLHLYLDFIGATEEKMLLNKLIENSSGLSWPEICQPMNKSIFNPIFKNIDWQQEEIKVFNKWHKVPRKTAWEGDTGMVYTYSGVKHVAKGWLPETLTLKSRITTLTKLHFNTVLYNWYRDGNDSMGWHSDNEKELGQNPQIASVSLGDTRTFRLRNIKDHKATFSFELPKRSLLIMGGSIQHHWQHCLPKRTKNQKPRINMTFRNILS